MSKAEKSNVGVTKNLDSILTDKARKILEGITMLIVTLKLRWKQLDLHEGFS